MQKRSLILLLAFPVIFTIALFLCWTSLKQSFVEWTLQEYCRKSLGVSITYDKAHSLKDNVIYLQGVTVSPVDPEASSLGLLTCLEAYVKVGFDFRSKTLMTSVLLENFELDLNRSSPALGFFTQRGKSRRSHLFDLQLSVQGEGEMAWLDHSTPLNIDFNLGQELEGSLQWDQASGMFRIGQESRELVFLAHRQSASLLGGLISFVAPGFLPVQVEDGWLSGSISLTDNQLVAAVDGDHILVSKGACRILFPKCHADADEEAAQMIFDAASLNYPLGQIQKIQGQLSQEGECIHLQASGESSGAVAITDIVIKGGKVCEGSHIELASESLYGEVTFQGAMGFAHFLGDDLEIGAIWDPKLMGCQGEVILFGKDHVNFSLSFSDDLSFQNGFISGKDIDLSELPSFSVWDQTIHGEGLVSLSGQFDASSMILDLHTDQLEIHGRDWNFTTHKPHTGQIAYHWKAGDFLFESEIQGAMLEMPKKDLSLNSLAAHCIGDTRGLRFEQCLADCQGIKLGGDVLISFHPEMEIEFYQHTLLGSISGIQSLLCSVGASHPSLCFPITGTLSCGDQGGFFRWNQESGVIEGTIGAQLSNGMMADPLLGTKWDRLEAAFVFDLREDHLEVREGKGICETPRGDVIPLILDHFDVVNFSRPLITFDLWCGDKKRDLVRACGKTVPEEGVIRVVFDPLVTHFGALYPEEFDLCFGMDGTIDRFHLVTGFQLETLETELKHFFLSKALSRHFVEELQGSFYLRLDYEQNEFLTFLHGKHLFTPQQKFQDFQFQGSYKNGQWHIEKLELDDFSLAADLVRRVDGFDVTFLGCQWGETSLIGLDGFISSNWDRIEANLNLVDLNLCDLETVEFLRPLFSQFHPQGSMRAHSGRLLMELSDEEWNIDLSFMAALKNFSLDHLAFEDLTKISVSYQTDKRLLISGGVSSGSNLQGIRLEPGDIEVDLNRHEFWIRDASFEIPLNRLDDLNAFLMKKFPGAVNSSLSAVLREIEPVEPLTGTLNFSLNPIQSRTEVCFQDGQYRFLDAIWDLKEFTFLKLDRDITLSAKCHFWDDWIRLKTQYVGKSFPSGVLTIDRGEEQLNLWWRKEGTPQISLEKIEGVFAGAKIDMFRQGSRLVGTALSQELMSQIEIDSEKVIFKDLSWKGTSAAVICPLATIGQNDQGQWEFEIPRLTGESFRALKLESWQEFINDSLIVKKVELLNMQGPLMDPKKVTATGSLVFHSPRQPEIRSFPFVKEKIQDLSVFKPVSGEVAFDVHEGRLTLTSLTDVVDQRHMFRYCLPSSRESLLSSDGTVHLLFHLVPHHSKVRMGDLVSVVVEGTLDHPSFSLVKTKELR